MEDYEKCVKQLEVQKIEFHTFSNKKNKTHAFVVRTLENESAFDELKSQLIKIQIKCYRIPQNENEK